MKPPWYLKYKGRDKDNWLFEVHWLWVMLVKLKIRIINIFK